MNDDMELEKQIKEILGELAGVSSMCWDETPSGVFDSTQAISFVQKATNEIMLLLTKKQRLEAIISGHMEAMRPLLDEWSKLTKTP